MVVTNLFIKEKQKSPVVSLQSIACDSNGIYGNIECLPLRQVLITQKSMLDEIGLSPGELRENIVVDFDDLYNLASGTVIELWSVKICLTFHCEPCGYLLKSINRKFVTLLHKRWFLGKILNAGNINIGDRVKILDEKFEEIPYHLPQRIKWFLDKHSIPIKATSLLREIGLSKWFARALPAIMKNLPEEYKNYVIYLNKK